MNDKTISETVVKALGLLELLGKAGTEGLSLGDAAQRSGLSRPTAHRLLNTLVQHAFAERPPQSRAYRIGPAVGALAHMDAVAGLRGARWRSCLAAIAAATDAAAFLLVRSGDDALCVEAHVGSFMLQTLTNGVGGRIPLGVGPGSIAILAAIDEAEAAAILERNAPRLRLSGNRTLEGLQAQVVRARRNAFAFDPGELLAEVRGLAVIVPRTGGALPATVSIASLTSQLPDSRVDELCKLMRCEITRALVRP